MDQPRPHSPPLPTPSSEPDILTRVAAVADRCASLCARRDDPAHHAPAGTRPKDFPTTEFNWLRTAGLLADPLPHAHGGTALNAPGQWWTLLQVLKHVGRGSLPTGRLYEGHVNALALVERFGTPAQQTRTAADVHTHGHIFGVWNADDDPPAPGLRLIDLGHGRYRMEGRKIFCSGAGHLMRPIVGARWAGENGGWQLCLLPMDQLTPRIDASWWNPLGMEGSVSAAIDFTGIELGPDTLLGAPNDYYQEPGFNGGAIRFAAVHLGGAESLYDAARDYLRQSRKADQPAQRIRFADLAIRIESGSLWLRGAAASAERPPTEAREIVAYAAMTRTAIESDLHGHDHRRRARRRCPRPDASLALPAPDPRPVDVHPPTRRRHHHRPHRPPRLGRPTPRLRHVVAASGPISWRISGVQNHKIEACYNVERLRVLPMTLSASGY